MAYKTPGVYVEEISKLPPSVAQVETAIPAFIGYTQEVLYNGDSLLNKPVRIKSLADFVEIFGGAYNEVFTVTFNGDEISTPPTLPAYYYKMYHSLQIYFANGGGPCYIVSVGDYKDPSEHLAPGAVLYDELKAGLTALRKEDEPTLIVFPDAASMASASDFYQIYKDALVQSAQLGDRFTLIDVYEGTRNFTAVNSDVINGDGTPPSPLGIRTEIGNNNLKYGAAYYPWLETIYSYAYDGENFVVNGVTNEGGTPITNMRLKLKIPESESGYEYDTFSSLYHYKSELYNKVITELKKLKLYLPASSAIAGVYARVDAARGVWKAPANESLIDVKAPAVILDNEDQAGLNVHTTGKSINAIRRFTGKGNIVWGGRTLAGNDNEWRYINVRRFYNMVEESVKKASEQFVFEPNDANTWVKVRTMIENFLIIQWRAGALQGAVPEDAFFVKVGLGQTMTSLDILEGRMIVEIGLAVVRPAEFIILKFSHKMQES